MGSCMCQSQASRVYFIYLYIYTCQPTPGAHLSTTPERWMNSWFNCELTTLSRFIVDIVSLHELFFVLQTSFVLTACSSTVWGSVIRLDWFIQIHLTGCHELSDCRSYTVSLRYRDIDIRWKQIFDIILFAKNKVLI